MRYNMKNKRNLKVYSSTRSSLGRNYYSHTKYIEVPAIILSGKWVEAAGFSISDNIIVEVEDNRLVITKKDTNTL